MIGGFRSLSGFRSNELRGTSFGVARLGYYYKVLGPMYAGGFLEAGNVWQSHHDFGEDPFIATTILLAVDTPAGPLFVAFGSAEEGNQRAYLSFGRSF